MKHRRISPTLIVPLTSFIVAASAGCRPEAHPPGAAPASTAACPAAAPKPLAELPVSREGGFVLVAVAVDGRERTFVLDTGSAASIVDDSFAKGLERRGKDYRTTTPAGVVKLPTYAAPRGRFGAVELPSELDWVACSDLANLSALCGREISGILGMDFLGSFAVRLDFARGTVELLSSDGRAHPEWGEALPLRLRLGCPEVAATVADVGRQWFWIDTGSTGGGTLPERLFRKVIADPVAACLSVVGGSVESRTGLLSSLTLGTRRHTGLAFCEGRSALLGLGVLSRYTVTLDFPGRRLYLRARDGGGPGARGEQVAA